MDKKFKNYVNLEGVIVKEPEEIVYNNESYYNFIIKTDDFTIYCSYLGDRFEGKLGDTIEVKGKIKIKKGNHNNHFVQVNVRTFVINNMETKN